MLPEMDVVESQHFGQQLPVVGRTPGDDPLREQLGPIF